jgi:FecR-like protein
MTHKPEEVLRELCRGVFPVPDPELEAERRQRIAARVRELQRELGASRQRRRLFGYALALAAIVGGVCSIALFMASRLGQPERALGEGPDVVQLVAGRASFGDGSSAATLALGQLVVSREAVLVTRREEGAELRLSSQTALQVAPSSAVGLARNAVASGGFEERVLLRAGSVSLVVPKLGTRGKVSVETGDALVEVHGTRFSVRVVERPPLDAFTEVDVREGRVLVSSGTSSRFLGAGEHWSSIELAPAPTDGALPAAPSLAEPNEPVPPARGEAPVRSSARASRPQGPTERHAASSPSDLAAQNQLLEAAELAQKSKLPGLALDRLEALINRYPDSELSHNARVERFRILNGMGKRQQAAAAARAYLERHPDGFARDEAERLIDSPPAAP